MKVLSIIVTILLVQTLTASLLTRHSEGEARHANPFEYKYYYISKSSAPATVRTSVSFLDNRVSFTNCNTLSTFYTVRGNQFKAESDWAGTYLPCKHNLDEQIEKLFNEANRAYASDPSRVDFFQGKRWLFTIKAVLE